MPDLGSSEIDAKTAEGDRVNVEWKNAKVAMPIVSTNKLSKCGKALLYHEAGWSIINPARATKSDVIENGGTNFSRLLVSKRFTHGPKHEAPSGQGFARQGAAP